MSAPFGATSTTDEVLSGIDLGGKRVLVTGISAGLGRETARALVAHGAQVVGTARDLEKAGAASTEITKSVNQKTFTLVELDLASLASVRTCADQLLAAGESFDLVIANAGVMACPFSRTADGFEMQFGTNHLGHFVLINRIAPLLKNRSRVVVLSSAAHRISDVDLDDPNFLTTDYDPMLAYGRSKTANALFAAEFDRRHRASGVRATAVHPGIIRTELVRHMEDEQTEAMFKGMNAWRAAQGLPPFEFKSIPQGAATSIWAGVVADADQVGGRYCEDCHVVSSDIEANAFGSGVRSYALDPVKAAALWARSESLVNEQF